MLRLFTRALLFSVSVYATVPYCQEQESTEFLIYLTESTQIVRELIAKNALGALLEEHEPEQFDLLLNNFSPAQMAFEAEVLSSTTSLVIVYFYEDSPAEQEYIRECEQLAIRYNGKVKFVVIDMDALFVLAQDTNVTTSPTLFFVHGRDLLKKVAGPITISMMQTCIQGWLTSIT